MISRKLINILMKRDKLSRDQAIEKINQAVRKINYHLDKGELNLAHEVPKEVLGLEPDILFQLLEEI